MKARGLVMKARAGVLVSAPRQTREATATTPMRSISAPMSVVRVKA